MHMNPARMAQDCTPPIIGLLLIAALAGCATSRVAEMDPATPGWEDHRFANQPHPYDRLVVEIDAVEGAGPSPHEVAELEAFLRQSTDKPGGITVKVDDIIPRDIARQRTANALALEYLDGPRDNRAAFIYILYYRSKLAGFGVKPDQPHFTYSPYPCSVFIDKSYGSFGLGMLYRTELRRAILLHEIGHALGLARNTAHGKAGHCQNEMCLMHRHIRFAGRRFITFRQPWENTSLCIDCRRDLEGYKTSKAKSHERLWNGYFVHEKAEYQTVTLPGFLYLHLGNPADLSIDAVAEARQSALASMKSSDITFSATTNTFDLNEQLDAVARFAREHSDTLGYLVERILEQYASVVESMVESEPEAAGALKWDALIAASAAFPEIQVRFTTARQKLQESEASLRSKDLVAREVGAAR